MASPQVEHGHLKIADGLFDALTIAEITRLDGQVMNAIMRMTYRAGKTKAAISAQDIRIYLGGGPKLRTDRIQTSIDKLVSLNMLFRQQLNQQVTILGVQKDFEKWGPNPQSAFRLKSDKMSASKEDNIYITNSSLERDKMSVLLEYALTLGSRKPSTVQYRVELRRCKELYRRALVVFHSPDEALTAVRDYIDYAHEDEFVRGQVAFFFAYALPRFNQWLESIPKKPREVVEEELYKGKRFRYDVRSKRWRKTDDPITG